MQTEASPWFVYMVICSDATFYTGITTDVDRRLTEHNLKSTGARYTRSRRPVELVYVQVADDKSSAQKLEHKIRKLSVEKKIDLIAEQTMVV